MSGPAAPDSTPAGGGAAAGAGALAASPAGAAVDGLRPALLRYARAGRTTSYRALAEDLGLQPPGVISRLGAALEALMAEDAAAGRPFLAALCLGRATGGLPGRGFFLAAQALGRFTGEPDSPEARAFHESELFAACTFYGAAAGTGGEGAER